MKAIITLGFFLVCCGFALLAGECLKQGEEIQKLSYKIEYCDSIIKIYETYN